MKSAARCASIAATVSLGGCGLFVEPPKTDTRGACKSWGEIGNRKGDAKTPGDRFHPETAREILGNNVAREEWCGPSTHSKIAKG